MEAPKKTHQWDEWQLRCSQCRYTYQTFLREPLDCETVQSLRRPKERQIRCFTYLSYSAVGLRGPALRSHLLRTRASWPTCTKHACELVVEEGILKCPQF